MTAPRATVTASGRSAVVNSAPRGWCNGTSPNTYIRE
jgi:hypothetical protein